MESHVITSCPVERIDLNNKVVNGEYKYEQLVTTVPWPSWCDWAQLPPEIDAAIRRLRHTSVDVDYWPENEETDSHWTYVPSEEVPYHRKLFRHNYCHGARGHWTEANSARSVAAKHFRHRNEYAYPISTVGKPEAVAEIHRWAASQCILPLGRWGTWEHMNSDVAVSHALKAAELACA